MSSQSTGKPTASRTAPSRQTTVTHLVDSTILSAMRYDAVHQQLTLTFRDHHGTYRYSNVPPELWSALLAAPSKGTFLNQTLKPLNLPFQRLRRA